MSFHFMEEYDRWMDSPALSESEWEELNAIADDEKEIENRFFAPLEFGTAGLRGTMKTGLHHMNIHVIRHATQAFADVIRAAKAVKKVFNPDAIEYLYGEDVEDQLVMHVLPKYKDLPDFGKMGGVPEDPQKMTEAETEVLAEELRKEIK